MNNSLERLFDDLIRLLTEDVLPLLQDDAVRSQVFGAVFMLKNLRLRVDWAGEPLISQIRAQDEVFAAVRDLVAEKLPSGPRIAADPPTGSDLLALRDAGNALIARLVSSDQPAPAMAPLKAYMLAELDAELRHTPKPMFAEMSSGKAGQGA